MNLNSLLQNTNYWYKNAFETDHARRPIFYEVLNKLNGKPAKILEIGAMGGDIADKNGIHGSGHSSIYFAEYVRQNGGELIIVDIDSTILENCKVMMEDFIKARVNIKFICDDGLKHIIQKDAPQLTYLDLSDNEILTYEAFRLIDRTKTMVLCDDANGWERGLGKCVRLRKYYQDYTLYKCENSPHELVFYDIIKGNNETFKIGGLELPYYDNNLGNREYLNERRIEIPLGQWFLDKFDNDVVEIGATMPYYTREKASHVILDPWDKYEGCQRTDGRMYDYTNKNVLSLSSIEHVSWGDGYSSDKNPDEAIKLLEKIIKESKNYLIEWGVGQHPYLDNYIQDSNILAQIMVRENFRGPVNNWREGNKDDLWLPYGSWDMMTDLYGNSLAICTVSNLPEIFLKK